MCKWSHLYTSHEWNHYTPHNSQETLVQLSPAMVISYIIFVDLEKKEVKMPKRIPTLDPDFHGCPQMQATLILGAHNMKRMAFLKCPFRGKPRGMSPKCLYRQYCSTVLHRNLEYFSVRRLHDPRITTCTMCMGTRFYATSMLLDSLLFHFHYISPFSNFKF